MTRLDALKELAEMVEAGECPSIDLCVTALAEWSSLALASFDGSLDATKALHEAVLRVHDLPMIGRTDHAPHDWFVNINYDDSVFNREPARAWLLAILRALIEQEESA